MINYKFYLSFTVIGDKSYINHAYEEANLRVMHTPNVVRKDEPNEIVLEILNGNYFAVGCFHSVLKENSSVYKLCSSV